MRLALQPQGFQGAPVRLPVRSLPTPQPGQIPQGLQEARHLPPGVVAEVVAGRRPPELVVVMTGSVRFGSVRFGSVLFWAEVFFVYFFAVRAGKGAVFGFSGFLFGLFFGFLDFFS